MIAATIIVIAVLPLLMLRRRTLFSCWGAQLATTLLALLLQRHVELDPRLGVIALAVVNVAIVLLFVARGRDVQWSANRAALFAALIYALALPAMLHTPIDGDEPYYLLVTESLIEDHDLDLANQYATLHDTASGRRDLVPQDGDPTGAHGEQYSRHEPFLPLVMIPGYLAGGLHGAIAIIALFGVLLVRSTFRWLEDEGIDDDTARAVFPFFAFGPPILFYAVRIWPEVPAAFCFVEALRGLRDRRAQRWLPALLGMVLLKLRFVLIGAMLLLAAARTFGRRLWIAAAILALPLLIVFLVSGNATNVHSLRELLPGEPMRYALGVAGLLADGAAGLAFQAPFFLLGIFALTCWRSMPEGFRLGALASILYLYTLLPRAEWHGGWSPPLRYIVVFMPVLGLGAAAIWKRVPRGIVAILAIWTAGLVIHGLAYPWRLFHIANGENATGEWLSILMRSDVSRFFPSAVRENEALWIAAAVLALALVLFRFVRIPTPVAIALLSLALALGLVAAREPGATIQFEDAHVVHEGGELHPRIYTVARFLYQGGWILRPGDSMSFLARDGNYILHYSATKPAMIELGGHAFLLPATGGGYAVTRVNVPATGRVTLRAIDGEVNLDRMNHE